MFLCSLTSYDGSECVKFSINILSHKFLNVFALFNPRYKVIVQDRVISDVPSFTIINKDLMFHLLEYYIVVYYLFNSRHIELYGICAGILFIFHYLFRFIILFYIFLFYKLITILNSSDILFKIIILCTLIIWNNDKNNNRKDFKFRPTNLRNSVFLDFVSFIIFL